MRTPERISGNAAGDGVFALGTLFGGGHGYNTIQNNIIGLDPTGTVAMGNLNGIGLQDSPANHVLNNVLSANHDDGLLLMNPNTGDTHGTVVTGSGPHSGANSADGSLKLRMSRG